MTKYYTPSDGDDIRRFLEQCNDELWTKSDIANYFMCSPARVQNWSIRYDDFPMPVIKKARGSIYLKSEIKDFIESKKFKSVRKEYWDGVSLVQLKLSCGLGIGNSAFPSAQHQKEGKDMDALRWGHGWITVPDTMRKDLVEIWEAVTKLPTELSEESS